MKVKIIKCSHPELWYSNRIGEIFDVVKVNYLEFDYQGIDEGTRMWIKKEDCEVVDDNTDFLKHRMTEDKLNDVVFPKLTKDQAEAINQSLTDPNMKQIKMSIDTAREMYKDSTISTKNWLLENFTKEELEPKKGFTWEESFKGSGQFINPLSGKIEGLTLINRSPCEKDKCLYKTTAQAESALAFAQLSHIVARYNEGKVFGFPGDTNIYFYVTLYNGKDLGINTFREGQTMLHLPFCDYDDANASLVVNKELWEKYWMIKKY